MLNTLQIETTNVCNGKCVFCPVPTMKRQRGIMPMDLFKKIIDDCKDIQPKEVLPFLNGEPFLDPHILERIEYINKTLPHSDVVLYSNGNLLTADNAEKLALLRVRKINFSINAVTEDTRQTLMGLPLEEAILNIFRYKDLDPTVKMAASMILDPSYVDGTDATGFRFFWEPRGIEARIFLPGNWAGKLKPSYNTKSICCRPEGHMTVLIDGRVCLCCFDPEGEVILGDLNTQTVEEVWEGQNAAHYREKNKNGERADLELCRSCTTI